ncbi:MAG TPA: class I SAM-dependent methyltransferase [Dehalococcoidia bacterium]|nr:class I SAM-dependent methyltransferase [Dehalococcoidia bacterium]
MTSSFPPDAFRKEDESPDRVFYEYARLVNHIDDYAIAAVGEAYRRFLPPDGEYLDLMSSWVSHFPANMPRQRIVGHGMNEEELKANPALAEYFLQDLNEEPVLPFEDGRFDGVVICVSVQYLTRPVEVFAEIGRVLKPGCPLIVAFSNRCFPMKAVRVWTSRDDAGHARLVSAYAAEAGAFEEAETYDFSPRVTGFGVPEELKARVATGGIYSDPLFVVVARRKG